MQELHLLSRTTPDNLILSFNFFPYSSLTRFSGRGTHNVQKHTLRFGGIYFKFEGKNYQIFPITLSSDKRFATKVVLKSRFIYHLHRYENGGGNHSRGYGEAIDIGQTQVSPILIIEVHVWQAVFCQKRSHQSTHIVSVFSDRKIIK